MNIIHQQFMFRLPKNRFLVNKSQMGLLFVMFISWIAVIMYCDISDYKVYFDNYYRLMNSSNAMLTRDFEKGFYLVMFLFAKIHLPFEVFYGVYMSVAMLFLGKFINDNAKHKAFVWVLCILFPFFYYVQQIRSTMATMIVLYAVSDLADSNKGRWRKAIKFLFYCVIAFLFHQSSLLYVSFVLALYIGKAGLKKLVVLVNILTPMILFMLFPIVLKGIRLLFKNHWMIDEYFFREFTIQKYTLFVVGIYFIFYLVLLYIDNVKVKGYKKDAYLEFYYKLSLIICMLAPIVYFTVLADRIVTMAIPIGYVLIDRYEMIMKEQLDKFIALAACLIFAVMYLSFMIGPWNPGSHDRFFNEMWKLHPKVYISGASFSGRNI